uniref:Kinesin motor domain-containing protein n=1 Tax=Alexandrium monilatum TaxID=311494 RepID=A0A7S4RWC9_9DINO
MEGHLERFSENSGPKAPTRARGTLRFAEWQSGEGHATFSSSTGNNIRVAVRIRPFSAKEEAAEAGSSSPVVQVVENSIVIDQAHCSPSSYCQKGDKSFTYDHVFSSINRASEDFATQEKVFEEVGFPILENAFNALNGCLLAYGQTGSGKSYSVLGDTSSETEKGILPRACETVFAMIAEKRAEAEKAGEKWQATVLVSYLEIYQEKMFDLLVSHGKRTDLQVRMHPILGPYVPHLTESPVNNITEVEELLDFGSKNRAVSATSMNAQSSRSHAVFSMELRLNLCGKDQQSKIHLVDLAGSEKQKKTEAEGARLQEGIAINQSLTTLSRVIMALAAHAGQEEDKGRRKSIIAAPPFRESKLTLLLKEALSGNSRTVLVACISPSQMNVEESLSTLEFASRCKLIKTSAKKNEQSKRDLIEAISAEKKAIEEQLKQQLEQRKALQEQLENEAEEARRSHEFAERMKEEKLAIEKQLREMEMAHALAEEAGNDRPGRRLKRAVTDGHVEALIFDAESEKELVQLRRENESKEEEFRKEKERQLALVQELKKDQERWEMEKSRELEEINEAHQQLVSEVQRLEKEKELQVSQAEIERQKALEQLDQTKELQERERQEWAKRQQESERRAAELENALRQQEVDRAERERLEHEQMEVQRELLQAQQEQQQCLEEAKHLRCEREQQLHKVEEDREQAIRQLRELRERQEAERRRCTELLAEKERQAEEVQQARDRAAEQAAREHMQRVERLQREKDEELSQAGAKHRKAVATLQEKLAEMEELERTERESAAKAQAREMELRHHIDLDLKSHEAREEELLRELRSIQSLSDSWALERQDLERRAQEQKKDREQLLKDLGIMGMDQQAIDSRTSARLVNLHPDPMLEGCLVYYLPQGETHIGADNRRCRMWLTGLDVGEVVCAISNTADKVLTIRALQGGLVRVNGTLVASAEQSLKNGDRLAVGRAHIFRVVVPQVPRGSLLQRSELEFDQAMRELQECAEIDPRWRRRVDAAVLFVKREFGTAEAKQFLHKARAASEAIAEANALVRSVRNQPVCGHPHYELSILFEADSPPLVCVVCRRDASEDGLGDHASGTTDLAAEMLAADGGADEADAGAGTAAGAMAASPGCAPRGAEGLGMAACSAGIWEAGRFVAERLPHMRWAAVRLETIAGDSELRRQLLGPDDWESRTAAAAAAAAASAAAQEPSEAAGLGGQPHGSEVDPTSLWHWWMSQFCSGTRGGVPGAAARPPPPSVQLLKSEYSGSLA